MTMLSSELGAIWGFGSGEHGPKYTIEPRFKFGFAWHKTLGRYGWLSITATRVLGGRMHEKPCIADYGEIGEGAQAVNCRFAASPIPPEMTLPLLVNAAPADRWEAAFHYSLSY